MWQRFSERARRAIYFAQEEAVRRGAGEIDAEHLLLGVLRNSDNVAAFLLGEMGISPREVYEAVAGCLPVNDRPAGEIRFQPRARRVIDRAGEESRRMNNRSVATEHLLIGLIGDEGVAGGVLSLRGVTVDRVRGAIARLVAGGEEPAGLRGRALSGLARLSDEHRLLLDGPEGVPLAELPETLQQALGDLMQHAVGAGNAGSGPLPLRVEAEGARVRLVEQNQETGPFRLTLTLEGVTLSAGLAPQRTQAETTPAAAGAPDGPSDSSGSGPGVPTPAVPSPAPAMAERLTESVPADDGDSGVVPAIIEDINRQLDGILSRGPEPDAVPPPRPQAPGLPAWGTGAGNPEAGGSAGGGAVRRQQDEVETDNTYYVPPPAEGRPRGGAASEPLPPRHFD